jgi:hypothetical protein
MLSPADYDVIVFNVSDGDFMTVNISYAGQGNSELYVSGLSDLSYSTVTGERFETVSNVGERFGHDDFTIPSGNTQFRVYAESEPICLGLYTVPAENLDTGPGNSDAGGVGTWTLAYQANEADVPYAATQPGQRQLAALEARIQDLESRVAALERQLAE